MWTRRQIKGEAKDFLRSNYFKALIVCIIFQFLLNGGNILANDPSMDGPIESYEYRELLPAGNFTMRAFEMTQPLPAVRLLFGGIVSIFAFIILLVSMLIGPLLEIGKARFFLKGLEGDTDIRYLFSSFNRDEFWNVFKVKVITNIYIFLWSLLLLIPGLVKSYEYSMVDYILANNPNLNSKEAINKSREMTYGHKFDMFILDLSFIGWIILGSLLFGVGIILVMPYITATKAALYRRLAGDGQEESMDYDDLAAY